MEVEKPHPRLGSSEPLWPRRPRPSAAAAVSLPRSSDPILLVYRPAAVGLLHPGLGHMYPSKPVGLADVHAWQKVCLMIAILPCSASFSTDMPQVWHRSAV